MAEPLIAGCGFEDFGNRGGVEHHKRPENAEHKAKIAHAVDHEGLDRGGVGSWFFEPEADQQVRGQPHPFPSEEHLDEVVGCHQHQHREGEQREIGEEARLIRVLFHVPP